MSESGNRRRRRRRKGEFAGKRGTSGISRKVAGIERAEEVEIAKSKPRE